MNAELQHIKGQLTAAHSQVQTFGKDLSVWGNSAGRKGGLGLHLISYAQETMDKAEEGNGNLRHSRSENEVQVGWQRARAVKALQELPAAENVHDTLAVRALQSETARVDVKIDHYRSRMQRREQVLTPIEQHFISCHPSYPAEKRVNICKLRSDPLMVHPKRPLPNTDQCQLCLVRMKGRPLHLQM